MLLCTYAYENSSQDVFCAQKYLAHRLSKGLQLSCVPLHGSPRPHRYPNVKFSGSVYQYSLESHIGTWAILGYANKLTDLMLTIYQCQFSELLLPSCFVNMLQLLRESQ